MWAIPILVPVLAALVILISPKWNVVKQPGDFNTRYNLRENRKRFAIFLVVSFVLTGLVSGGLYWIGSAKMWYKEVWNNKITKVRHEEKWTTKEQRSRQVPDGTETYYTGTGANRTAHTRTKYRTEYYYVTETHGPYWNAYDDQGSKNSISSATYQKWMKLWANEKKVGEHRGSSAGFDRAITGGIFESYWPKTFETMYPYATIHKYKNKVRQAPSVLKLPEPTEELAQKYPRPADKGNTSPVIYYGGKLPDADDMLLRRVNAKLGRRYQIHSILVVFSGDSPRTAADDVLRAWQGPNKNELATFMSIDGTQVKWCEVHSWLDNTTIHGIVRDGLMGEPFSCQRYADLLLESVPKHWHRKQFEDFEYLKVNIHWGWSMGAFLASIVIVWFVYFGLDGGFSRVSDRMRERRFDRMHRRMRSRW